MVNGWQLEEAACKLFAKAIRSNVFDVLAIIDDVPTLIAVCKSPPYSLVGRFYSRDWNKMKEICHQLSWNRLLLVYCDNKWYEVTDMEWLDSKVASSKSKTQQAIGLAEKAIVIKDNNIKIKI